MPVNRISNGRIENISRERENTFITVTYAEWQRGRENQQTVRLVVGPQTVILNQNGLPMPVMMLRVGMIIDAVISSAMTRSIPPQATAYLIRIVRRAMEERVVTIGTIVDVNRNNRSFTMMRDQDLSTIMQLNVPENALIFGRMGQPINFARLMPSMRVRVAHANFMTASIPPQTTAFEVRVL